MAQNEKAKEALMAALIYDKIGGDIATGKVTITDDLVDAQRFEVIVTRVDSLPAYEFSLKERPKEEKDGK